MTTESPASNSAVQSALAKVPQVTLIFWILKIFATTLGETAGDALSMGESGGADTAEGAGYLMSTAIFGGIFALAVAIQILVKKFNPVVYWITIIATTTVGTTLADFCTRDKGLGYPLGSASLAALLGLSLIVWRFTLGTISVESIKSPKPEVFYWVTIMFSQTLGTALGDWTAHSIDLGYGFSAAVFGGLLLIIAAIYRFTKVSRTGLFWAAFVLTRPLGAVVGDLLDKPHSEGGLALSRYVASGILIGLMALGIAAFRQKPAGKSH